MSPQELKVLWTLLGGPPPSTGDVAMDELLAHVLIEEPVPADAIIWLQGNGYDRGPKALELFLNGYAPRIVVTGNRTRSPITVEHLAVWLTDRGVAPDVVCIEAQSLHTRDQAIHVLDFARERQWQALILVASPHHQLRAFLTFLKRAEEVAWSGRLINQPAFITLDAVPGERTHTERELFSIEQGKIAAYRTHTATIEEGLQYVYARK